MIHLYDPTKRTHTACGNGGNVIQTHRRPDAVTCPECRLIVRRLRDAERARREAGARRNRTGVLA